MSRAVICIVKTRPQAEALVAQLKDSGIGTPAISVLFPGAYPAADSALTVEAAALPGKAPGTAGNSVVGGVLDLLAGIGMLAIPGAGPHLTAGPIIAALSGAAMGGAAMGGAAMGAAVGGIAGALIWLGLPQTDARRYATWVHNGALLVAVHAQDDHAVRTARDTMDRARAARITLIGARPGERPAATRRGIPVWRAF